MKTLQHTSSTVRTWAKEAACATTRMSGCVSSRSMRTRRYKASSSISSTRIIFTPLGFSPQSGEDVNAPAPYATV